MGDGLKEGARVVGLRPDISHLSPEELDNESRKFKEQKIRMYELTNKFNADKKIDELEAGDLVDKAFDLQGQAPRTNTSVDPKVYEAVEQAQKEVKDVTKNGNPVGFDFGKMFGNYGNELKNFFKSIFGPIIDMFNRFTSQMKNNEKLTLVKNDEQRKVLESYGVKTSLGKDKSTILQFEKDARIGLSKKTNITEGSSQTDNKDDGVDITVIEDGKINIGKDSQIKEIKEIKDGTITCIVVNKDGSTDAYRVANIKKIEAQKMG